MVSVDVKYHVYLLIQHDLMVWPIADRHRCIDHEGLRDLLDYINRDMDTARYVLHHNETMNVMWDYVGAASFVLSVISTIGRVLSLIHI